MIGFLRRLFGLGELPDLFELRKEGVAVLDVRTKSEYQQGHMAGSQNIPLDQLSNHHARWRKEQPIITCCASGVRSAQAAAILRANGFTRVFNGGGWKRLASRWRATGPGGIKHI